MFQMDQMFDVVGTSLLSKDVKRYKLGEIFKITSGGTPSRQINEYFENGSIPWAKTGDLKIKDLNETEECITQAGLESSSAKLFPRNTVLIAMYGATIGACSILRVEASTNQACAALLPNANVDVDYLYYYLLSIKSNLVERGVGGGQPNISATILKDIEIPLPALTTQKQIGKFLEQADIARQKRKAANRLTDEFLQNTFLSMFGDPVTNEKGWEQGMIRDVVTEVKYGTSKPAEENGSYPYLRMNNIDYKGNWDFSSLKFINLEKEERQKYLLRKGDLVFNRTNSKELVGKTAVYHLDDEMAIAGYLIRVRTSERANPYYMWGYLNSIHGKSVLFNMCKNIVGMANINAQELQDIRILIPPIELQDKFASIVTDTERLRQKQKQSEIELENLFQALLQKYFG